jgi:methionyl-tRNA formyltransferase
MTEPRDLLRVVVLSCGDLGVEVAQRLLATPGVGEITLVTTPYRTPARSLTKKIRHLHRMEGWPGLLKAALRRVTARVPERSAAPVTAAVRHYAFGDFHDAECLQLLRTLHADLGVIAGTYILGENVFTIPRLGCINLHSGRVPEYRGSAPAFWELYNGAPEVAITIHRVARAVDAGEVLLQQCFLLDSAPPGDPMRYIEEYRRDVLRPNGVRLLCDAVARIAAGTARGWAQDSARARTYRLPDYRAVQELRRRVRARRGRARRRFKQVLGFLAFRTGLYRGFLRNKALVVLLHRIDDRLAGESITCTSDQLTAYCRFFHRYFRVIPLGALLEKLARGEDISRTVVITFDDGYKDNHDIAASTLRHFSLPACFFIATNFIGSSQSAWWDAAQGITSRWMTWDDVRAVRRQGFDIGSHTMSHADLGTVAGAAARHEIVGARDRLAAELHETPSYFSYPYGGREHMGEENRTLVRETGHSCCLSAHGGVVTPQSSPFALPRVSLSPWFLSPYQFGFEAMRWT